MLMRAKEDTIQIRILKSAPSGTTEIQVSAENSQRALELIEELQTS